MLSFDTKFLDFEKLPAAAPHFDNVLKVLAREKPSRPVLFELFLNDALEANVLGLPAYPDDELEKYKLKLQAFAKLGYDYTTIHASRFHFATNEIHREKSISANDNPIITDWESFEKYKWNDPKEFYTGRIESLSAHLPEGMKLIIVGPGGPLENIINLVGYDNLCYLLADDPELVAAVYQEVEARILQYYELIIDCSEVGAVISNDDWGFNTQTMLSPADLRKYVFPCHKKVVQLAHSRNKPVILHSCGQLQAVMDEVIDDMHFDGKHSYEDNILPVEQAYDLYHDRIAIVGGIDVDFLCRKTPEEIYNRCVAILEQTDSKGYMLGSGNSIPNYVPVENYMAMIAAAVYNR